jgi:multimeric flavodoxin WrbA
MKILAISGGHINGSNDAMAREALMGAKQAGAEIEFIRLLDLNLKPCTGCIACVNGLMTGTNGDCVIKDDMNWLAEKIFEADGIIWVIPIFEKGAPAVLHIVRDRLFGPAFDTGINIVAGKIAEKTGKGGPDQRKFIEKVTSFIGIGGSDWSTRISADLNLLAMVRRWKVIDDLVFQWSKSIILDDKAVAQCNQLGKNIVEATANVEHAKFLGDPGICPNCHCRNFYFAPDNTAVCVVCGIEGEMQFSDGKIKFIFPDEMYKHAHNTIPGKLKHMDDIYHNEMKLKEEKQLPEFKARVQKYKDFIQATLPEKR